MFSIAQKRFALILLAVILWPAAGTTCVPLQPSSVSGSASHKCCNMPALGACDCPSGSTHDTRNSEPAQRVTQPLMPVSAVSSSITIVPAAAPVLRTVTDPHPPRDVGDRLSLLATLLV